MNYKRISFKEREEISIHLAKQYSYHQIARILRRSPSSICREIRKRNFTSSDYKAIDAQINSTQIARMPRKQRKLDINLKLQKAVMYHLELRWSPEQIARRLKILYPNDSNMRISHETIYSYIYIYPRKHLKRQLLFYLRRKHKYRKTKNKVRKKTCPIQNFVSIDERPPEVNSRKVPGHWEGDLIMGPSNRSAIGTLVERTSRMTFIVKLKSKDATTVRRAFARKLNNLPEDLKKSLTYDQGQEMAEHALFTKKTKIDVYFAHPHSPWERGTSENTNSLIRDFFPKGTDFSKISSANLLHVQNLLNERPRKVLGFYTPKEVFGQTLH